MKPEREKYCSKRYDEALALCDKVKKLHISPNISDKEYLLEQTEQALQLFREAAVTFAEIADYKDAQEQLMGCEEVIHKLEMQCRECRTTADAVTYCSKCDGKILPGASSCPNCGALVRKDSVIVYWKKEENQKSIAGYVIAIILLIIGGIIALSFIMIKVDDIKHDVGLDFHRPVMYVVLLVLITIIIMLAEKIKSIRKANSGESELRGIKELNEDPRTAAPPVAKHTNRLLENYHENEQQSRIRSSEQDTGLKATLNNDGTVTAVGDPQICEVTAMWKDIVDVSASRDHVIACNSSGFAYAAGNNDSNQCMVFGWEHIVAVRAAKNCSYGLCRTGHGYEVVFSGEKDEEFIKEFRREAIGRQESGTPGTVSLSKQESNAVPREDKPIAMEYIFCRKCGKKLPMDSGFCTSCGTKVIDLDKE